MERNFIGTIKYKNILFYYTFDGKILKMNPEEGKELEVEEWFSRKLANGVYTYPSDPVYCDESILIGTDSETNQNIVFIPSEKELSRSNYVLLIQINAYVVFELSIENISKMDIKSPELDAIYYSNKAIDKLSFDDGVASIQTKSFGETSSNKRQFKIGEKIIEYCFHISRTISYRTKNQPLTLHSLISLYFEFNNDYALLINLANIIKKFLQYLCYRKNIYISEIKLFTIRNNLYYPCGNLYIVSNENIEDEIEALNNKQYISYDDIDGYEHKIFNDIANKTLYLRHIPQSYSLGKIYNEASFIMLTAAFEYEFKRLYPNGVEKSEKSMQSNENVRKTLIELKDKSTGKTKKMYKYLLKRIDDTSLKDKIVYYGEKNSEISDLFALRMYKINNIEFSYEKIGERLSKQRNNFAHGNITQEFIPGSLADIVFLKKIIYIIQLKYYGLSDEKIKIIVNQLFKCNVRI